MTGILSRLQGVFSISKPSVGIEIAVDRVVGVALAATESSKGVIRYASVLLPDGAVVPTATENNIVDRVVVIDAIRLVLSKLPRLVSRVGLVIPDIAAKVSFVQFDHIPQRSNDLRELLAWQVRKSVPFSIEDAQLACIAGVALPNGGREFIVTLMRRDIVKEYEAVCVAAGVHAGLVDLASFNLINGALAMSQNPRADWLLVHIAPGYVTFAIVRGQVLIFFRNRPTENYSDLSNLVHQAAMYYRDHLDGHGLSRTVLVDSSNTVGAADAARESLKGLGTPIEHLIFGTVLSSLGVEAATVDPLAAPIGLVMREHSMSAA